MDVLEGVENDIREVLRLLALTSRNVCKQALLHLLAQLVLIRSSFVEESELQQGGSFDRSQLSPHLAQATTRSTWSLPAPPIDGQQQLWETTAEPLKQDVASALNTTDMSSSLEHWNGQQLSVEEHLYHPPRTINATALPVSGHALRDTSSHSSANFVASASFEASDRNWTSGMQPAHISSQQNLALAANLARVSAQNQLPIDQLLVNLAGMTPGEKDTENSEDSGMLMQSYSSKPATATGGFGPGSVPGSSVSSAANGRLGRSTSGSGTGSSSRSSRTQMSDGSPAGELPSEQHFQKLSVCSWEQTEEWVKIYVPIRGVQTEMLRSTFRPNSVEVKVIDLKGKNYSFSIHPTFAYIEPTKCSASASKSKKNILVTVQKMSSSAAENRVWPALHSEQAVIMRQVPNSLSSQVRRPGLRLPPLSYTPEQPRTRP